MNSLNVDSPEKIGLILIDKNFHDFLILLKYFSILTDQLINQFIGHIVLFWSRFFFLSILSHFGSL